jgi:hypothetical protein
MMIEIYGAGFSNKGAQLMLLTVLKEMGRSVPTPKFCMSPAKDAAYSERARYGLQHTFPIPRAKELRNFPLRLLANKALGTLIPKKHLSNYGLVRNQDVDALVMFQGSHSVTRTTATECATRTDGAIVPAAWQAGHYATADVWAVREISGGGVVSTIIASRESGLRA